MLSRRPPVALAVLMLTLLVAACGGGTTAPTVAPTAAPTAAATAAPTVAATVAATTAPTAAATAATKPAATAGATAATTPAAATAVPAAAKPAAGGLRLTLVPEGSEARYRAREQLANRSLPNDAIGATKEITGLLVLGANGAIVRDQSKITVNLSNLKSDSSRRDGYIQQSTLETSKFPEAVFVPTEVKGLPSPLPASGQASFQLLGDLTLHGVTKPATWDVTATFNEADIKGQALTSFKLTDFGMEPPRVAAVLSIEEVLKLELDFQFKRETVADAGSPALPAATTDAPAQAAS